MAAHVCASSGMVAALLNQVPLRSPAHFSAVKVLLKPELFWSSKLSGRLLPDFLLQNVLLHVQLCTVSHCVQHQKYPHLHLLWSLCACMCSEGSAFCRGVFPRLNRLQVNLWQTEPTKAWQPGPQQDQQAGCSIQAKAILSGTQR